MKICVDHSLLSRTPAGAVTSGIWIRSRSGDFPATSWDDFAASILAELAGTLVALTQQGHAQTVYFLEGPFSVTIMSKEDGVLRLMGHENGIHGTVRFDEQVAWDDFAQTTEDAAQALLRWCSDREWIGRDEVLLSARVETLSRVRKARLASSL